MKDEHPESPRRYFLILLIAILVWLSYQNSGQRFNHSKPSKNSVEAHVLSFVE